MPSLRQKWRDRLDVALRAGNSSGARLARERLAIFDASIDPAFFDEDDGRNDSHNSRTERGNMDPVTRARYERDARNKLMASNPTGYRADSAEDKAEIDRLIDEQIETERLRDSMREHLRR